MGQGKGLARGLQAGILLQNGWTRRHFSQSSGPNPFDYKMTDHNPYELPIFLSIDWRTKFL